MRDREGASFLLPLFSTIILGVRGDKGEVGLRFSYSSAIALRKSEGAMSTEAATLWFSGVVLIRVDSRVFCSAPKDETQHANLRESESYACHKCCFGCVICATIGESLPRVLSVERTLQTSLFGGGMKYFPSFVLSSGEL